MNSCGHEPSGSGHLAERRNINLGKRARLCRAAVKAEVQKLNKRRVASGDSFHARA
jgi:hypothetical protein